MRRLTLFIVLFVLSSTLFGQIAIEPELVKKMVVFIYPAYADGKADKHHPLGTGFLIFAHTKGASLTKNPDGSINGLGTLFLLTARHVIDPNWANCPSANPSRIYIRVNLKNYDSNKDATGVDYLPVDLIDDKGAKNYLVRDDDATVDGAVVSLGIPSLQNKYDVLPMDIDFFGTSDEIGLLREGDEVFSAGLIPDRSGENRNYPFFKFGNISNILHEETSWSPCAEEPGRRRPELMLEKVWFIAINLIGGNSGSPVFFNPSPLCQIGGIFHCERNLNRLFITGIQSSSFLDPTYGSEYVSGMTPIEEVFKIIKDNFGDKLDLYRGLDANRPK